MLNKIFIISTFMMFNLQSQNNEDVYIYRSSSNTDMGNWFIVDDGVMGGLSKGSVRVLDTGNILFSGNVTTENNGGFSSVRCQMQTTDVTKYTAIKLRVKGDGKYYQLRIKENSNQWYSYVYSFKTSGNWETISIPFNNMEPKFRGRSLSKGVYEGTTLEEIGFLIGNKVKESFSLEIESIALTK